MRIRRGENKRESWWVTNNTNNVITIGDLPQVPAIQPEKRADILRYYSREKISHSDVLVDLVRDGTISLEKQKIFTDNNLPGDVSSRDIEKAITPAEENETGAILYHTTEDNVLIKTDLDNDALQETNIIIDNNDNLFTPSNINLETNKNIYFGNKESQIYWANNKLNIDFSSNPSEIGTLNVYGNVVYQRQYATPDSFVFTTGSTISVLDNLRHFGDGNEFIANEAASPGLNFEFTFNNITHFSHILFKGYYDAGGAPVSSHGVKIEVFDNITNSYDTIRTLAQDIKTWPAGVDEQEVDYFALPDIDDDNYINNETVLIRFIHTVNGNTNHMIHIDYLGLEV